MNRTNKKKLTSPLDTLFAAGATKLSGRVSRRSFMTALGRASGATVFFSILAAELTGNLGNQAYAATGCTGSDTVANPRCGMNGNDCSGYGGYPGTDCDCSQCLGSNGCPSGTTTGLSSWSACCPCTTNTSQGQTVKYQDCCGTPDPTKCGCCGPGDHHSSSGSTFDWCLIPGKAIVCSQYAIQGPCTP